MQFIKLSLVVFLMVAATISHAEEKSDSAESEAPAGVAAEEGEPAAASSGGSVDREWANRTSKLNVLEAKMKDLTKKIKSFIEMKKSGKAALDEKGRPIDVFEAIVVSHKELKETVATYAKESAELKYRYPEKGEVLEKKYIPLREQSLEQIEKQMGLDGELTRLKKKIDKKYCGRGAIELIQGLPLLV